MFVVLCVIVTCGSARGMNLPSWVLSKGLLEGPDAFSHPTGIGVNGSGCVYVCDTSNNRIQIFGPNGQYISKWGTSGSFNGEFSGPQGVAFNSTGAVYVADTGNSRVQVFTPSGQFLFKWNKTSGGTGTGNGEFNMPAGIAVNATGYVYVADSNNNRVQVFSPSGSFITKWGKNGGDGTGGTGNGEFNQPTGIAINGDGKVYVTDSGNLRVQVFSTTGQYLTQWTGIGTSPGPNGIVFNSTGYAFVSSSGEDKILVYAPDGTLSFSWQLDLTSRPFGVAINATQHVFVCEYLRNRVTVFAVVYPTSNGELFPPEVVAIIVIVCVGAGVGVTLFWYLKKKAQRKEKTQPKQNESESLDFK